MKLGSYRIYNKSIIKKLEKFYKIYWFMKIIGLLLLFFY
jgi:hypothetical protein